MHGSSGCLVCCSKNKLISSAGPLPEGQESKGQSFKKPSKSEDFWSTSVFDMDNSAIQSQGSISSISTSNQTHDPHGGLGSSGTPEFVNHGLLLWNQTRQQWVGNKKNETRPRKVREPKLSWNVTYESLLGSNKPFPQPVPLSEMVDFLVDVWEQEDHYYQLCPNGTTILQESCPIRNELVQKLYTKSEIPEHEVSVKHMFVSKVVQGEHSPMALARFAFRNLQQKLGCSPSSPSPIGRNLGERTKKDLGGFCQVMSTDSTTERASDDKEVAVSGGGSPSRRGSSLFRRRNRQRSMWRYDDRDVVPALYEFFPSGLGNALMQATENINRLFDSMNISPWQLTARVKEEDDHYKIRYEVPGLTKEDLKITVHDGILSIKGEQRKEEEEGTDDERWSATSYGYYNTSLILPEDAKVDEIKAELKDGVLSITVPRTENPKREVKEVPVH